MTLPMNYTCSNDKIYSGEAPGYIIKVILYGFLFAFLSFLPASWCMKNVKARGKELKWSELNQQDKMMLAVSLGGLLQFLAVAPMDFYMTGLLSPVISLFLQCGSAICVDTVLVLAVTGWTGMNNIQGKTPTVPGHYQLMKHASLGINVLLQLTAVFTEASITLSGDDRVPSDQNTSDNGLSYTYYDGTLSALRQLANLLIEGLYWVVCIYEGRKLRTLLSQGGGDDNPAAKKISKYINTATFTLPVILLYRLSAILGRLGTTAIGSTPSCSFVGTMVSPVDIIFILTFCALCYVLKPSAKKKVAPKNTASTTASSAD